MPEFQNVLFLDQIIKYPFKIICIHIIKMVDIQIDYIKKEYIIAAMKLTEREKPIFWKLINLKKRKIYVL